MAGREFAAECRKEGICGRNSVVECQLPKLDVVGSNPIARSLLINSFPTPLRFPPGGSTGKPRAITTAPGNLPSCAFFRKPVRAGLRSGEGLTRMTILAAAESCGRRER